MTPAEFIDHDRAVAAAWRLSQAEREALREARARRDAAYEAWQAAGAAHVSYESTPYAERKKSRIGEELEADLAEALRTIDRVQLECAAVEGNTYAARFARRQAVLVDWQRRCDERRVAELVATPPPPRLLVFGDDDERKAWEAGEAVKPPRRRRRFGISHSSDPAAA
jgi:hypothetical protein